MRVVVVCVLATVLVAGQALPAGADLLQDLADLIVPPSAPPPAPPPAPPAAGGPAPAAPAPAGPAPAPGAASSSSAPQPVSRPVISVPQIRRSPPRSTDLLFKRLHSVVRKGVPLDTALLKVVAPFPLAGAARFSHDWGFPRYTPYPHRHEGTDIFAAFGTPIVTSESGRVIRMGSAGAGGISVWVHGDSGMAYYYAHLQSWIGGLAVGQRVEKGAIIGFVGDTGNARGGQPHLHFETHPGGAPGTPARDPKPFLDDALRQAVNNALNLARQGGIIDFSGSRATGGPTIVVSKKVDKLLQASSIRDPGDLMWFSLMDPSLGVLALARLSADTAGRASPLSAAETKEEQRLAEVRSAVGTPRLRYEAFLQSTRGENAQAQEIDPSRRAYAFATESQVSDGGD